MPPLSEYAAWKHMRARCLNPTHKKYKDYGGRGITICQRWDSFNNFLADMGLKPGRNYSLDRKDNDGNYEPGNCRWATRSEQQANKRVKELCKRGHRFSNKYLDGRGYRYCRLCKTIGARLWRRAQAS